MAITKIHPIRKTLQNAIDYITDLKKTNERFIYSTTPIDSFNEEILSDRKEDKVKGSVLARHLIQSFAQDEIDPKTANEIGKKLAEEHFEGHKYIVVTHFDKSHIHNHILVANYSAENQKCYQSNKKSYHQIRELSDKLCKEYNVSIIESKDEKLVNEKYNSTYSYKEHLEKRKGLSKRELLKKDVDFAIENATDYKHFINILKSLNYETKDGKYLSIKSKNADAKERFIRVKSIGEMYFDDVIKERIILKEVLPKNKNNIKKAIDISKKETNIKMLDIGYKNFVEKHNLQSLAEILYKLREERIYSIGDIDTTIKSKSKDIDSIIKAVKSKEMKIKDIKKDIQILNNIDKNKHIIEFINENKSNLLDLKNEYSKELFIYNESMKKLQAKYGDAIPETKDLLNSIDEIQIELSTLRDNYKIKVESYNQLKEIKNNYIVIEKNESIKQNNREEIR